MPHARQASGQLPAGFAYLGLINAVLHVIGVERATTPRGTVRSV